MQDSKTSDRHYQILVYAVEQKGLTVPSQPIQKRNFTLHFEPFRTPKRFNEFDGVILFQGIFEQFKWVDTIMERVLSHSCEKDELDKRKKEVALLCKKGGFLCFLLSNSFIDQHQGHNYQGSDLAKYHLNYPNFYRENFATRVAHVEIKVDDFRRFLELYGAAWSHFSPHNDTIDCRVIAEVNDHMVGMVLEKLNYFIPALIPDNRPETIAEYFTLLGDSLVSSANKLYQVLPAWVDGFTFAEESGIKKSRDELTEQIRAIDTRIDRLKSYKEVLALSGHELAENVIGIFRDGFGFTVDPTDNLREDFKLVDEAKKPFLLCEVKGTNKGVQREHVNQADSHRERSGFDEKFPSLLIINTGIKNARSVTEKDQEVAMEQVLHAQRMGVLIVRTLDILWLLRQFLAGSIPREEIIKLLTTNAGWLRATKDGFCVISGEENALGS